MTKLGFPATFEPIAGRDGQPTQNWQRWFGQLSRRLGYSAAKVYDSFSVPGNAMSGSHTATFDSLFSNAALGVSGTSHVGASFVVPQNYTPGGDIYFRLRMSCELDETGNSASLDLRTWAGSPLAATLQLLPTNTAAAGVLFDAEWSVPTTDIAAGTAVPWRVGRDYAADSAVGSIFVWGATVLYEAHDIGREDRA